MENKKLRIPKEVADRLGVDIDEINRKMQLITDSKKGLSIKELMAYDPTKDFDNFSKNEILALFMDAASEAGFLKFKMIMLLERGMLKESDVEEVFKEKLSDTLGIDIDKTIDDIDYGKDFL